MSRILRRGDHGPDVANLQRALTAAGWHLVPDAQFGPKTEAAVKAYQYEYGLPASGIADEATLAALLPALIWGVDVSENQPLGLDWHALAAAGCAFAIIRAMTGADRRGKMRPDAHVRQHTANAREAGIDALAFYGWAWEGRDGAEQGRLLVETTRDLDSLALVLDYEPARGAVFRDPARAAREASAFIDEVETAAPCLIYTAPYAGPFPDAWASRRLWLAHPGATPPPAPKPWAGWTLWQQGTVHAGVDVDKDVYRGSLAGLRGLFAG